MSTVAEIESAISQLGDEEFLSLQTWMAKHAGGDRWRKWSSEEIGEGEKRFLAEPDPLRAERLKLELMRGFYGPPDA